MENSSHKRKKRAKYTERFEELWLNYGRRGDKMRAYIAWERLDEEDKKLVEAHYPHYVSTREHQYTKLLERYLSIRDFENPVYFQNEIVYDPDAENKEQQQYDTYKEQLEDVRWKAFRDFVFVVRGCKCEQCGATAKLQVHHPKYIRGRKAWEYTCNEVMVVCKDCHEKIHNINN